MQRAALGSGSPRMMGGEKEKGPPGWAGVCEPRCPQALEQKTHQVDQSGPEWGPDSPSFHFSKELPWGLLSLPTLAWVYLTLGGFPGPQTVDFRLSQPLVL